MSEMVEQGARAMWEERRRHAKSLDIELEEWGDGSIPKANNIMGEARAMLNAMREPTDLMLVMAEEAAPELSSFEGRESCPSYKAWTAMIDEALK